MLSGLGSMLAKKSNAERAMSRYDMLGLPLQKIAHAADIQDRDGGVLLMANCSGCTPFLVRLCAGSSSQGPQFNQRLKRERCFNERHCRGYMLLA